MHDLTARIKILEETSGDPKIKEMQLLSSMHGKFTSELTMAISYLSELSHPKDMPTPLNPQNYRDIVSEKSLVEYERISLEFNEIVRIYRELQKRIQDLIRDVMVMNRSYEMSTAYTAAEMAYDQVLETLAQSGAKRRIARFVFSKNAFRC